MKFISTALSKKMVIQARKESLIIEDFPRLKEIASLAQHQKVIPAPLFFELHEHLDDLLGPGFAVRVGQQMKIEDYGVLGLSWKTCTEAGEIFKRSERYFKLLSNTYVFKIEKEGEYSKVYLFRDNIRRGIGLSNEATFSATVKVLQATTETDIAPVEVAFKHSAPTELHSHQKGFNCNILFDQPAYYICYKTKDLETPTAKSDQGINRFLLERVEEEVKGIQSAPSQLLLEVKGLIKDALPSGIPNKNTIGKYIGMSNRTLTRRLSETGLSFREIIESTQQEIAKDLLQKSSQTISEIAFQAGFSEQSAFNRAFKRWTGQTPTSFRKA